MTGTNDTGSNSIFSTRTAAALQRSWEMEAHATLLPQWWCDKTHIKERKETDTCSWKNSERGYKSAFSLHIFAAVYLFQTSCPSPVSVSAPHIHLLPGVSYWTPTSSAKEPGAGASGWATHGGNTETVFWALSSHKEEMNCAKPPLELSSSLLEFLHTQTSGSASETYPWLELIFMTC